MHGELTQIESLKHDKKTRHGVVKYLGVQLRILFNGYHGWLRPLTSSEPRMNLSFVLFFALRGTALPMVGSSDPMPVWEPSFWVVSTAISNAFTKSIYDEQIPRFHPGLANLLVVLTHICVASTPHKPSAIICHPLTSSDDPTRSSHNGAT